MLRLFREYSKKSSFTKTFVEERKLMPKPHMFGFWKIFQDHVILFLLLESILQKADIIYLFPLCIYFIFLSYLAIFEISLSQTKADFTIILMSFFFWWGIPKPSITMTFVEERKITITQFWTSKENIPE